MTPKISIIIPVYNAGSKLSNCVQSIINQDFTNFELLLINDGSTDESGIICDAFAKDDHRIRVFHQNNAGVSAARNKGIENAIGEWMTFIDADDYITENYFKVLNIQSKSDWIHLNSKRDVYGNKGWVLNFENRDYVLSDFTEKYSLYPHFAEAWGKFFKKSIIQQNNLKFDTNLKFGEDSLFNLKYLKFCKIISTSNLSKYVYENGEDGLSKLKYEIKNDTILFKEIEKELKVYQYPSKFCQESIRIPLTRYLKILYYDNSISTPERRHLLKKTVEKYYKICLTIYTNPKVQFFFIFVHFTGFYSVLDVVLSKLNK